MTQATPIEYAPSTAATSLRPPTHSSSSKHTPPTYNSPYDWHRHDSLWYRAPDPMGLFALHWQKRFYGHGDMYISALVSSHNPETGIQEPLEVSEQQLRQAVRRLRFAQPFAAIQFSSRRTYGLPLNPEISNFIEKKVDVQCALTYEIVETEEQVNQWLDQTVRIHSDFKRRKEDNQDIQQKEYTDFLAAQTDQHHKGSDRLIVHFFPASDGIPARFVMEQCHNHADGIGTLLILDDLLDILVQVLSDPKPAEIPWGEEISRLPASLQDATANQPESWDMTPEEHKVMDKINQDRLSGKATKPNAIDKFGTKLLAFTLKNNRSKNAFRSKVINKPIVSMCRNVAQGGAMLPLGLLPQTRKPYKGPHTHTGFLTTHLTPDESKKLIAHVKAHNVTVASFLEACMHMATSWIRRERGLSGKGYDPPNRIFGSFSNSVCKRSTLRPEYSRYHGLCLGGAPTKIAADKARWDPSVPTTEVFGDRVPTAITDADMQTVHAMATELAVQYRAGREDDNWLRYGAANYMGTMETEYLLLTDEAHYPSMPWLSSIGRLETYVKPDRPLSEGRTLHVEHPRVVGRMGIRQSVVHAYSYRGETIIHCSYAQWLYDLDGSEGRRTAKGEERERSVLKLWFDVFQKVVHEAIDRPLP